MNFGIMPAAAPKAAPAPNKCLEQLKSELHEGCVKSVDFEALAKERVKIVQTFARTSQQNARLKELLRKVDALDEGQI